MVEKIKNVVKRVPKRLVALAAIVLVAVAVPVAINAWGPDRPALKWDTPATYNVFNSITNNPSYGDERNFALACEVSASNPSNSVCNETGVNWKNSVSVENGKEYFVRLYVHNNKAANLNASTDPAKNVKARVTPWGAGAAKSFTLSGIIESSNTNPAKIWDEVMFTNDHNFKLSYVAGSAVYTNGVSKFALSISITTSENICMNLL